jgi:nicotinamide-nucleotide amidase
MTEALQDTIVELITIGREILDGRVLDTNSVKIAELLKTQGLIIRHAQRVDDHKERIINSFKLAASRSHIVLVTGGLGPTSDDITMESLAAFLGVELEENAQALADLEKFLKLRGRSMSPAQRKQALLPKGVEVLPNPHGTAPGVFLVRSKTLWAFMPGVPLEMIPMMKEQVLPRLPRVDGYTTYGWATQFTAESSLQDRLAPLIDAHPHFEISYRTRFPENHIGLHAVLKNEHERHAYESLKKAISEKLGTDVFSEGTSLLNLEEVVLQQAREKKIWIACVESCTGGGVAQRLTSVPGSSENFFASWTTYHNRAKQLLGVPEKLIETQGAVSEDVSKELARAGLLLMQQSLPEASSLLCVSTTGIAGPGGGTPQKPVGLCYIGLASWKKGSSIRVQAEKIQAPMGWDRPRYQLYFSQKALNTLRLQCQAFGTND